MRGINVQFVPHQEQRYNTVGDWWLDKSDVLQIRVSALSHVSYMVAIAVHEIIEAVLCLGAGIREADVDQFDKDWELGDNQGEPGDSKQAPYHLQHGFATAAERLIIAASGGSWEEYDNETEDLSRRYRGPGVSLR